MKKLSRGHEMVEEAFVEEDEYGGEEDLSISTSSHNTRIIGNWDHDRGGGEQVITIGKEGPIRMSTNEARRCQPNQVEIATA